MYVLVTKYNHKGQNFRQLNLTTPPPPLEKNIRLIDVLEHKKDKGTNKSIFTFKNEVCPKIFLRIFNI